MTLAPPVTRVPCLTASDPPTFDLQSHSVHSDGDLAPAEVVSRAAAAGVGLLALSDHDTVDGVAEAMRAGEREGVRVVSATEISALDRGERDLHILGYGIDASDPRLLAALASFRSDRERRAERMIDALRELGFAVDPGPIVERSRAGRAVGRPHIADAVVADPGNATRLGSEGIDDPAAFLAAYLVEGRPAFRTRRLPTVSEAVALIHGAGGVAVWAHPYWDLRDDEDVRDTLRRFREQGMDGVEAFYLTHTPAQAGLLADEAERLDMLTTGSSDFHGPGHRNFSRLRAHSTHGRTARLGPIAA